MLEIILPGAKVAMELSPNSRAHWRKKHSVSHFCKLVAEIEARQCLLQHRTCDIGTLINDAGIKGKHAATVRNLERILDNLKTAQLAMPQPDPPYLLTCTRYFTGSSKELDDDNLYGTFKPYRDGIAAGIGIDDGPKYMRAAVQQHRVKGYSQLVFTLSRLTLDNSLPQTMQCYILPTTATV